MYPIHVRVQSCRVMASNHPTTLPMMLNEALKSRRTLRIEYLDSKNRPSKRFIDPLNLIRTRAGTTLIAHCHSRNDQRTFRLDRIAKVELLPRSTLKLLDGARIARSK